MLLPPDMHKLCEHRSGRLNLIITRGEARAAKHTQASHAEHPILNLKLWSIAAPPHGALTRPPHASTMYCAAQKHALQTCASSGRSRASHLAVGALPHHVAWVKLLGIDDVDLVCCPCCSAGSAYHLPYSTSCSACQA